MPGRVKFATSTAPRPPLAALVANPTPPGQITRERVPSIGVRQPRDSVLSPIWLRRATGNQLLTDRPAAGPLRRATRALHANRARCPLYPRCRPRLATTVSQTVSESSGK